MLKESSWGIDQSIDYKAQDTNGKTQQIIDSSIHNNAQDKDGKTLLNTNSSLLIHAQDKLGKTLTITDQILPKYSIKDHLFTPFIQGEQRYFWKYVQIDNEYNEWDYSICVVT